MTEASGHAGDVMGEGPWGPPAEGGGPGDGEGLGLGPEGEGASAGGAGPRPRSRRKVTAAEVEAAGPRLEGDGTSGAGAGQTGTDTGTPGAPETVPNAVEVAEAWLTELADQVSVPATDVQDHLLDIWGALDEGPARVEVERWLTETLRRNLYSVSDINERLELLLPAG